MSQVVINSIVAAGLICLIGAGFGLIYEVTRFFHFAHGLAVSAGAYVYHLAAVSFGAPFWVGLMLAVFAASALGCGMEIGIYRRLRSHMASPMILLVASLGLYVAGENVLALLFGTQTLVPSEPFLQHSLGGPGWRFTVVQGVTVAVAVASVAGLHLLLQRTVFGRQLRATANDAWLALVIGIQPRYVVLIVFALGSALAGLAGVLIAVDLGLRPGMGLRPLLLGVIAVIIGGIGSMRGLILGAVLLGLSQNLVSWYVGNEWQDGVAFAILIGFLLVKPEGFFGRALRVKTV